MIDCELLDTPCQIGDNLSLQVVLGESEYFTPNEVNVTVTGAGFDLVPNLTLNSPPNFEGIEVEDSVVLIANEIDLVAGATREVTCMANVTEYDGDELQVANASFFFDSYFFDTPDDNNYHYLNQSCLIDNNFGNENESQITCTFFLEYYSDPGNWNCVIKLEENNGLESNDSDSTNVNELLAIGLDDYVDFGTVEMATVSEESELNVTNYGNVQINLSLNGFGVVEDDGLAMNCLSGSIPVGFLKYNLSYSNFGILSYSQFENNYTNLTGSPVVREFNLDYRRNEDFNEAWNQTYWRVYVPLGVAGTCQGNIIFGAVQANGV